MPPYAAENGDAQGRRQGWIALALVGLALVLRGLSPGIQQDVASLLRSSLLRPFISLQETLARGRARGVEVEVLRQELDSLMAVVARQRTLADENLRLHGLLELRELAGTTFHAVTVIRPGTAGSESTFMVDAGTSDGVMSGSPVLTRAGLVGVVRESSRGSSLAMDWTHPDFAAGAMTEDGSLFGIVEARRGRFREEDRLLLSGTAFHERIEAGTLVVTSGAGGVYPRGIPIGTVVEEAEAEGGWRRSYWLRPAVLPAGVSHAQVLVRRGGEGESLEWLWLPPGSDTLAPVEAEGLPAPGESGTVPGTEPGGEPGTEPGTGAPSGDDQAITPPGRGEPPGG
jgi:cell shape-determining protein MreC